MMRFDGPALEPIRQALGLTGVGAQITEFPDGVADQVVDVAPFVRRGRTVANSEGIFTAQLINTHVAAANEFATVDPYNATSPAGAGYLNPVPQGFDVWVLGTWAYRLSGAALVDAQIGLSFPATRYAFAGNAAALFAPLRSYNTVLLGEATVVGTPYFRSFGDGLIQWYQAVRVPRGASIFWSTTNAALAAVYHAEMLIGLFPAALGQDGVG